MKVTRITSEILRIPIRHEGSLGVGRLSEIENVLVRVETDAGLVGIGESSPWPVFAENCWSVKAALDHYLAPCLVGENPFNLERLLLKMDQTLADTPFAKAALDMALHDLVGKALNQPVYNLLGGLAQERVASSPTARRWRGGTRRGSRPRAWPAGRPAPATPSRAGRASTGRARS